MKSGRGNVVPLRQLELLSQAPHLLVMREVHELVHKVRLPHLCCH